MLYENQSRRYRNSYIAEKFDGVFKRIQLNSNLESVITPISNSRTRVIPRYPIRQMPLGDNPCLVGCATFGQSGP